MSADNFTITLNYLLKKLSAHGNNITNIQYALFLVDFHYYRTYGNQYFETSWFNFMYPTPSPSLRDSIVYTFSRTMPEPAGDVKKIIDNVVEHEYDLCLLNLDYLKQYFVITNQDEINLSETVHQVNKGYTKDNNNYVSYFSTSPRKDILKKLLFVDDMFSFDDNELVLIKNSFLLNNLYDEIMRRKNESYYHLNLTEERNYLNSMNMLVGMNLLLDDDNLSDNDVMSCLERLQGFLLPRTDNYFLSNKLWEIRNKILNHPQVSDNVFHVLYKSLGFVSQSESYLVEPFMRTNFLSNPHTPLVLIMDLVVNRNVHTREIIYTVWDNVSFRNQLHNYGINSVKEFKNHAPVLFRALKNGVSAEDYRYVGFVPYDEKFLDKIFTKKVPYTDIKDNNLVDLPDTIFDVLYS